MENLPHIECNPLNINDEALNSMTLKELEIQVQHFQNESKNRDELINKLRICQASKDDLLSKIIEESYSNTSLVAELATFQLKTNQLRNELSENELYNEKNLDTIKYLRKENNMLKEINERQKITLDRLECDLSDFRKYKDRTKLILEEYINVTDSMNKKLKCFRNLANEKNLEIEQLTKEMELLRKITSHDTKSGADELIDINKIPLGNKPISSDLDIKSETYANKIIALELMVKDLKAQIEIYKKTDESFKCDQKLSRETIARLSEEKKMLKISNEKLQSNFDIAAKKLETYKTSDSDVQTQLDCLKSQIQDMRETLATTLEEDMRKSEYISSLLKSNKLMEIIMLKMNDFELTISRTAQIVENCNTEDNEEFRDLKEMLECLRIMLEEVKFYS